MVISLSKNSSSPVLVALLSMLTLGCLASAATLAPTDLRCEYRTDPVGIDSAVPRFSWIDQCADAQARNKKQSAYQILVASDPKLLDSGKADLWDTGKIVSGDTNQIYYAGHALKPLEQCFWAVRVWDESDQPGELSATSQWTEGLLAPDNWHAKWIGDDDSHRWPGKAKSLKNAFWIGYPQNDSPAGSPAGSWYFRGHLAIPAGKTIQHADLQIIASDMATVFVNGSNTGQVSGHHRVQHQNVMQDLHEGDNVIAIEAMNFGHPNSKPAPEGIAGQLTVTFDDGNSAVLALDHSFKVAPTAADDWASPKFDDSQWVAAKESQHVGAKPWGMPEDKGELYLPPPPYLRTTFHVDKPVRRAILSVSSLGIFEMHLNGQRVGQDYFTPGYTDYRKRLYYVSYDVTDAVKQGDNAIGGLLGDGWYAGYLAWTGQRNYFGPATRLGAQLDIELADGSTQQVITDQNWKAHLGAIKHADMLHGCEIDTREDLSGWDKVGFNDSGWSPVAITDHVGAIAFSAYPANTVQVEQLMPAKSVTEPHKNVYVFDLGQNMVGWVRLKVSGQAGDRVVLYHGEMLNPDGTAYTANLRSARSTDEYILNGSGEQTLEPSFTFHGFRYVEVLGLKSQPSLDAVTGVVAHSVMAHTGKFACSSPLLNQLYSNITWGQKGNYFDIPTDCPQRDERQGWTGDAQVFIRTAACNYDIAGFFNKWLFDLNDGQIPDGCYPAVAPSILPPAATAAGWADAGVICPWNIYHVYGDTEVIKQHYDQMVRYEQFLIKRSKNGYSPALGAYGDWLNVNQPTPKDLIATAYFGHSTQLLADMSRVIGKVDDANKFDDLFKQIQQAFTEHFVHADGTIEGDSQTGYLLALRFDLVPQERRAALADRLIAKIKDRDWHLSTGFIGVNLLLPTLSDTGHLDVAYRLLQNTTYPSWGYSVVNGATTIWERWNSYTKETGFGDVAMNSFNHYSYGSAGQWMFSDMIGIDTDGPAFRKITLRPHPGGGISFVDGSYDSINGPITSSWKIADGGALSLQVSIPPNTTSTVYIPATKASTLTQAGTSVELKYDSDAHTLVGQIGSGSYDFTVKDWQ